MKQVNHSKHPIINACVPEFQEKRDDSKSFENYDDWAWKAYLNASGCKVFVRKESETCKTKSKHFENYV